MPDGIRDRLAAIGRPVYCIAYSARSGSTLLCEDLMANGLGHPTEYFQTLDAPMLQGNVADNLVQLVQDATGGCFAFKAAWAHASHLVQRLREQGESDVGSDLRSIFPDIRFIHLVRHDKLAQAVSGWRAEATGHWHRTPLSRQQQPRPRVDFYQLSRYLTQFLTEDWLWQSYFEERGIPYLQVVYEAYVADRVGTLQDIGAFLDRTLPAPVLSDTLQPMRDAYSDEVVERFRARLEQPPFWEVERPWEQFIRRLGRRAPSTLE